MCKKTKFTTICSLTYSMNSEYHLLKTPIYQRTEMCLEEGILRELTPEQSLGAEGATSLPEENELDTNSKASFSDRISLYHLFDMFFGTVFTITSYSLICWMLL